MARDGEPTEMALRIIGLALQPKETRGDIYVSKIADRWKVNHGLVLYYLRKMEKEGWFTSQRQKANPRHKRGQRPVVYTPTPQGINEMQAVWAKYGRGMG